MSGRYGFLTGQVWQAVYHNLESRFNQAVVYVDRLDLNFLPAGARADQDSNKPVADLLFTLSADTVRTIWH